MNAERRRLEIAARPARVPPPQQRRSERRRPRSARSVSRAVDTIVSELRRLTNFPIESRHKSVPSIVAKLRRRQPARLSAIQDLAGARIIVPNLRAHDELVASIVARYPNAIVDDKRTKPTFSYRAVPVIVTISLPYEIQVRTARTPVTRKQHLRSGSSSNAPFAREGT